MKIFNDTQVNIELIKAIALDVGLDLKGDATMILQYGAAIKGAMLDDNMGSLQAVIGSTGTPVYLVTLVPWASTEILAHELRHVAQCQELGVDVQAIMYQDEENAVGYEANAFEVDAREAGARWKM